MNDAKNDPKNFDASGPDLTKDDEEFLDETWRRIAERRAKRREEKATKEREKG